jgi:hypothetical protein
MAGSWNDSAFRGKMLNTEDTENTEGTEMNCFLSVLRALCVLRV